MSMKELADEAIVSINERMAKHIDSRCATADEVRMAAMACRIEELESAIAKHKDHFPDEALEGEVELWSVLDA